MTKEKFDSSIKLIRQKAKMTAALAEAVDSTTSPTIHNLWKSGGELDSMITALKSELAGNVEPKRG